MATLTRSCLNRGREHRHSRRQAPSIRPFVASQRLIRTLSSARHSPYKTCWGPAPRPMVVPLKFQDSPTDGRREMQAARGISRSNHACRLRLCHLEGWGHSSRCSSRQGAGGVAAVEAALQSRNFSGVRGVRSRSPSTRFRPTRSRRTYKTSQRSRSDTSQGED